MAHPKRRHSRSRRNKRRSQLKSLSLNLVSCPQCHQPKLPHCVCVKCGYYKGNKVIEIKVKKKKAKR